MHNLPETYIQRAERVYRSAKPQQDIDERVYVEKLINRLEENSYDVFISGLDSVIPLLPTIGRTCNFIDYGYQIEIAKRFSSSFVKVDFDSFEMMQLASLKRRGGAKAFLIFDLLCEVRDPEKIISGFNSFLDSKDMVIYITADRNSQRNKEEMGPPSCGYRIREWNADEFLGFISSLSNTSLQVVHAQQHVNNGRKDLVVYPEVLSEIIADCFDNVAEPSKKELLHDNASFEKSTFSFDIEFGNQQHSYTHGLLSYNDVTTVENKILWNLGNNIPSSLIRVGHAEIRLLGFPDFIHPIWASRSLNVCFGDSKVSEIYDVLKTDMLNSFKNANFIGVPNLQETDQHWKNAIPLLNFYGCKLSNMVLHSQNIHLHLLISGFYDRLLNDVDELLIIGCRDVREKLKKRYNISDINWIETPGEAKFVDLSERHYPEVYNRVKFELPSKIKKLVLVGAGLPGNSYCHWAKELGAVALDIGSVMDIWDNKNTRTSFNKFEKYAL
jgi:hypothetical protein